MVWTEDPSVCPYLYTDELSLKLKNARLIKMQVRPDGSSISSINPAIRVALNREPAHRAEAKASCIIIINLSIINNAMRFSFFIDELNAD